MTPNRQKEKGSRWERDFVNLLLDNGLHAKRVAGSGALGTTLEEPLLMGDVTARIDGFQRDFIFECKTGYGGSKQLTIKREWFDKIKAEALSRYSIPALACKFSGARQAEGTQYFIAFDFDTFLELVRYVDDMEEELIRMYETYTDVNRPLE